jgi:hypothetical protein
MPTLITSDPENSMPEPQPLSPPQKKIWYFLVVGAVVLAFGLYMGFVKNGDPVFVFALLGGSVALFAFALTLFLKLRGSNPVLDPAKAEPPPEVRNETQTEIKAEPHPEVKNETQTEVKAEPPPEIKDETQTEVKVEAQPEAKAETRPEAKSEIQEEASADVKRLMNTTLGELLLTTLLKDPEGAGRIVAQAIIQAEAPMAGLKTFPEIHKR